MDLLFANGARSRLNGAVLDTDLTIDINDASDFPAPSDPTYIKAKLTKFLTGQYEIVHITAISTNTLTISRAQEGTTALDFDNGDDIELVDTAGMLNLLQASYRPVVAVTGTTRTLGLIDAGRYLLCSNAAGCTITVPPQVSVVWPDNCEIHGRGSLGSCTFVAGAGVTIDIPAALTLESTAKSAWTLKREAPDSWVLIGNLVAA